MPTLVKTSTKTKIAIGIAVAAAVSAVAFSFMGGIRKAVEEVKSAQAAIEEEKQLDVTKVQKGGGTATNEVQRWLNANIKYDYLNELSSNNAELQKKICGFIDNTLAPSDNINGCGNGSSASVSLGKNPPKVTVSSFQQTNSFSDAVKTGITRYKISFTAAANASDADISVRIKCKVNTGLFGKNDSACPDPQGKVTGYSWSLAKSSAVLVIDARTGKKTGMEDVNLGKANADVRLKLCFDFVIAGKTCFQIGDVLKGPLSDALNSSIKDSLK